MTIKEFRESLGMNQPEFADFFEMSIRTLQGWEGGKSETPPYVVPLMQRVIAAERAPVTIRDIRKKAGMTQKQFAEFLGIPLGTLQGWEGGKRPPKHIVPLAKRVLAAEWGREDAVLAGWRQLAEAVLASGDVSEEEDDEI